MIQVICFFLCEICYLVFAKNWLISLNLSNLWTQSCNVCRICIDLHCFISDNGKSLSISLEFYPFCESSENHLLVLLIFFSYFFLNCSIVSLQCVSGVQQRDSVIFIYVYVCVYMFFFRFFFLIDYYKILSTTPYAIQWFSSAQSLNRV